MVLAQNTTHKHICCFYSIATPFNFECNYIWKFPTWANCTQIKVLQCTIRPRSIGRHHNFCHATDVQYFKISTLCNSQCVRSSMVNIMFAVMSLEVFISSERTRQNTCVIPYSPKTININNMFIRSYRNEGTQPINLVSSICNSASSETRLREAIQQTQTLCTNYKQLYCFDCRRFRPSL